MRKSERLKAILIVILGIAGVAILFFGINLVETSMERKAYAEDLEEDEDDDEEFDSEDLEEDELLIGNTIYKYNADTRNYLIIGTDLSGNGEDDSEEYHGSMADFLLVVAINRIDNTYAFLQIDRDTVTQVPMMAEDGKAYSSRNMQICTAHWYGGNPEQSCENTVNAVSKLLGGIPFEGYYEMNMEDIPRLNHSVGGVTITVQGNLTNADPTLIDGETITLTDEQAYNYVHARMDVGDGSNKERMQRQNEYMNSFLQKVIDRTKEDPGFPNDMFKEMKQYLITDLNGTDISRILNRISQGENLGIKSFEGAHKLGQLLDDGIDHQEFYIDLDSYYEVMDELYHLEKVKELEYENEEDGEE